MQLRCASRRARFEVAALGTPAPQRTLDRNAATPASNGAYGFEFVFERDHRHSGD